MKIGIVTPMENGTGISTYSIILANQLSNLGENVTILCYSYPDSSKYVRLNNNIDVIAINRQLVRESDFDIIHFQLGNSHFHEFQIHCIKEFRVGASHIITTIHDPRNFKALRIACSKCLLFFVKELLKPSMPSAVEVVDRAFLRISDGLIFHSHYQMKNCLKKHNYDGIASVIPVPGYRCSCSRPEGNIKNESSQFTIDNVKRLVVPGYISPYKGADMIIEAISEIKDNFELTFLGGTSNRKYHEYLEKLIHRYNLENKVKFTGFIDGNQYINVLNNSDIVLIPRLISPWYKKKLKYKIRELIHLRYLLDQSISGVITEALAAGKPIICSNTPSFSEYVTEKRGMLCEDNKQKWSYAIQYLLDNSETAKEMGKESLRYAINEINPEKIAIKHIDYYREVLENG